MGSESAGAKKFVAWAGSGWVAALQGLDRQRPGTNAGLRLKGTCVMTQGRHREAPVGRAQIVDFQNSWPSHDAREHSTASKGAMGGHRFCSAQHSSTRPLSSAHANIRSLPDSAWRTHRILPLQTPNRDRIPSRLPRLSTATIT